MVNQFYRIGWTVLSGTLSSVGVMENAPILKLPVSVMQNSVPIKIVASKLRVEYRTN
jgi:hypothetical protein